MRPRYYPHTLGGGVLLGLMVAQRAWLVFALGVAVGVALVFALRILRGLGRFAYTFTHDRAPLNVGRRPASVRATRGERHPAPGSSAAASVSGPGAPPAAGPLAVLTAEELEAERLAGLRQGAAAGVRAAARAEVKDRARREAMSSALEDHWREERSRSVRRAVES